MATIREAKQSDITKIKDIIVSSFPRFFRFFAAHSLADEGKTLVYETEGAIAGFARLIRFQVAGKQYGCVLWLATHPRYRRRGIAEQLVLAGTAELRRDCASAVFASIQRSNKASLRTFYKAGFVRISFFALWRLFGWRVLGFYRGIWYAPGEVVVEAGAGSY